jgi:hypothetical protein
MTNSSARARYAVGVIFFLNGAVLASWIPHIPEIKAMHGLSDGRLGCVLSLPTRKTRNGSGSAVTVRRDVAAELASMVPVHPSRRRARGRASRVRAM